MLTHDPAENPDHASITFLACGVRKAVATAAKADRREEDRDLRRQPRPSMHSRKGSSTRSTSTCSPTLLTGLFGHPAKRRWTSRPPA